MASFLQIHDQMAEAMVAKSKDLPTHMVSHVEGKVEQIKDLSARLSKKLLLVCKNLDVIKEEITANLKSDDNPDGLLTSRLQVYMQCLDLKRCDLDVLLAQDAAYWKESVKKALNSQKKVKSQIAEFLDKSKRDLEVIIARELSQAPLSV